MKKTIRNLLFLLFIFIFSIQMNVTEISAKGAEVDQNYEEALKQGYHTFYLNKNMDILESAQLQMYDPEAEDQVKDVVLGKYTKVPKTWRIRGQIHAKNRKILININKYFGVSGEPGSGENTVQITRQGKGKETSLIYTIDSKLEKQTEIHGFSTVDLNYATYNLNGGKWEDEQGTELAGRKDCFYQVFITPYSTVYQPKNPTREGYTFRGWTGKSRLLKEFNDTGREFKRRDYYQFDEIDPNITVGYIRGGIVELCADWGINPVLNVQDIEIFEGDPFKPEDLILSVTDDKGVRLKYTSKFSGDYDNTRVGSYPIEITVTNTVDGTSTKIAKLIVKKRPALLTPAPVLEVEDKEISVGDAFDPKEMVKKTDGEVKIDLPQDYDKDKEGKYTITFTVTNKDGIKITKTAVLTVNSKKPTKPEDPVKPENPSKPVDPTIPENPSKPVDPTTPENPSKPVDPTTPENPSKPVDPTTPENPSKSAGPAKHKDHTKPQATKKQGESKNVSPKTGDAMIASYAVLSLVSLGGLVAVSKKKED